ncbi:amidohydrolase family protein [Asticcacaulis sp. DXS10W]|uniref:Amidohydrolase family protein n=1 Tax=Asticcacaulis currens TaxID=2984210 RepID=A0ABT5IDL0_9CAUL|nr:amidohydrolase family protein [Asticcacaulis currens]MDC7694266.1 amidohydrolase family protein [Asticcacaulis currens]
MTALDRRSILTAGLAAAAAASAAPTFGAVSTRDAEPVIDVHLHAYPQSLSLPAAATNPITGEKSSILNGADHMEACLTEMQRWNVVKGVVSGGDGDRMQAAIDWKKRDPDRIMAGAGIRGSKDVPLPPIETLRAAIQRKEISVLGEITAQYAGLTLSDPIYDPYLALAVEFNIPVAVHLGTMPPDTPFDPCCTTARTRHGRPETIEEALVKHPGLRVNIMHSGWPYQEETIALLMLYPNLNIDTGAISWLLPMEAFHAHLRKFVEAGFGKRIMFGSDNMFWPGAIGLGIAAVKTASFLTKAQQRDILYNNAKAFLNIA